MFSDNLEIVTSTHFGKLLALELRKDFLEKN